MLRDEKGYALVLVLIIMLIFLMLGTALIAVSTSQVKEAVQQQERIQAYYLAYYGAEAVVEWIKANPNTIPLGESSAVQLDVGEFSVTVEQPSQSLLRIVSVGTVDNYSETVTVELTKLTGQPGGGYPIPDMAIFAISQGNHSEPVISLTGSRSIIGPVGTNATAENSVDFGSGTTKIIDGDLFIGFNGDPDQVIKNSTGSIPGNRTIDDVLSAGYRVKNNPQIITYPEPNFPEVPTVANKGVLATTAAGPVSGMIVDTQNNPLAGVKVSLSAPDGRSANSQHGGNQGFWNINSVRGRVIVTPTKEGYTFEPPCRVVTAPASNVDFVAIPGSPTACHTEPLDHDTAHWLVAEDGYYESINVESNRRIFIDLAGGDRVIVVDHLNISQGHLSLLNAGDNGRLLLYVNESVTLGGSSTVNQGGDIKNITMYYAGSAAPNFGGNTEFVGSLIARQASISIAGSNTITGHIITGGTSVIITGAADLHTRLFYAPNAHVSILGSGKVKGAVVANTFSAEGGQPAVIFDPPEVSFLPFDLFGENAGGGSGSETISWGNPRWIGD